jgi:hypothetical protein
MTISYPLSIPSTPGIKQFTLNANNATSLSRSPFTFSTQVQEHTGQIWTFEATLPPMERADAESWLCFLAKLLGSRGTFLIGDPLGKTPRGQATGTPLVKGASQTGQSIITDGWTPTVTGILKAGDYMQIGNRLYKVLTDTNSNGSGEATFDIYPRIRESPSDNAGITVTNTVGLFRLTDNEVNLYEGDEGKTYQIQFAGIEAI